MDTNALKKFAQSARNLLIDQVTAKLAVVLDPASAARREHPDAMKKLDATIAAKGKAQVIEQVAYTWFNRFTALRFMDVNGYTYPRVVSPADGATRPELLADAMAGNLPDGAPSSIAALLEGRTPSNDPQAEAYRLLLVHACNQWHGPMPFLFEQIDDYSELLMPEDLLSPTSILARLRDAMTDDACADVEIIGWLYQFYISEKKDQVFAGLKKNVKITAENIPAATQLFTPHWIVRYLVENSLGRLWLLNRPQSKLAAQMDYYIAPEEPETDFLKLDRPEDIRICDPACGSGHMLTYAFDLLHAIYAEEGYEADRIPALILTHNLHGVEIDDRAGALAGFALVMKAAAKLGRRKFLRLGAQPNVCVMQDVRFTTADMQDVAAVVGRDLFTDALRETLGQFEQAKNFGSLIVPKLRDPAEVARVVRSKDFGGDLLLRDVQERVLKVLEMAEALSPKYHVVVANPPYAGDKGLNDQIKAFAETSFPNTKSNLFSMFIERILGLGVEKSLAGLMTPFTWMYISNFEKLRSDLLRKTDFVTLTQLDYDAYTDAKAHPCAFVFQIGKRNNPNPGVFIRLEGFKGANVQPIKCLEAISDVKCEWRYSRHTTFFDQIPNHPIAYTASPRVAVAFTRGLFGSDLMCDGYLKTGNNERFLRCSWETDQKSRASIGPWRNHLKGGDYRKWSGNREFVVRWSSDAIGYYKSNKIARILDRKYWDLEGISWSAITSGRPSFRILKCEDIANNASLCIFPKSGGSSLSSLAYLNSRLGEFFLKFRSQTANVLSGDVLSLPRNIVVSRYADIHAEKCVVLSDIDWDAYETSWDFSTLPLLAPEHRDQTLAGSYARLRAHWQGMTDEMQRLEEENNRIFIDAYGLQDELTPEVPLAEITLTCNPAYRYGGKATAEELETRLRADTMAEFLHYGVGCMFGRYSLDAPGLIVNAGVKLGRGAAQNWATLGLRGKRAVGGGQSAALSM